MSNPFAWSPGPKEAQNDSDLRRKRPADQHHASSGQPSHRLCFFAPAFMDASARLWWPGIHVPPTGLPFTSPATPAVVTTLVVRTVEDGRLRFIIAKAHMHQVHWRCGGF